jgi:hypothetical protein
MLPSSSTIMQLTLAPSMTLLAWILTASGSTYLVARHHDGTWWCQARNVPNPLSIALPGASWWRIASPVPWPPAVGTSITIRAPDYLCRDDPCRMPGGGKHTSSVLAAVVIERVLTHDASTVRGDARNESA